MNITKIILLGREFWALQNIDKLTRRKAKKAIKIHLGKTVKKSFAQIVQEPTRIKSQLFYLGEVVTGQQERSH